MGHGITTRQRTFGYSTTPNVMIERPELILEST